MEDNQLDIKCHYCGRVAKDKKDYYSHTMYFVGSTFGIGYKYQSRDVYIPRCKRCKQIHEKFSTRVSIPMYFVFAAGLTLILYYKTKIVVGWIPAIVVGVLFAIPITKFFDFILSWSIMPKLYKIKPVDDIEDFRTIKSLLELGWKMNKPDPTVAGRSKPKNK